MPDVIEHTDTDLEFTLDREVMCEYRGCDQPAAVRMRMHLPSNNGKPEQCCRTGTAFACLDCFAAYREKVRNALPYNCHCGRTMRHVSDVILWVRSLR